MERLTKRSSDTNHENGVCCAHFGCDECHRVNGNCAADCFWEEAAWSRLADFEDFCKTPEELKQILENVKEIYVKTFRALKEAEERGKQKSDGSAEDEL